MDASQIVEADLTLIGGSFERNVQLEITPDGHIGPVGVLDRKPTLRLRGQALLPGMINAHSHAFQRGLRGRAEVFPQKSGNFWSWRDEMYNLVKSLDPEGFRALCVRAFLEMLHSGITTVGEFHYLHHNATCDGYQFDEIILDTAHEVGIRMVLLNACYMTGDIDTPLDPTQQRFGSPTFDAYCEQIDRLEEKLHRPLQTQGLVAHSIRAVPIDQIKKIHAKAKTSGKVLHMHVEEQQREIDRCLLKHKARPMELLLSQLDIGPDFTAVHCTHTHRQDVEAFIEKGANACICPTTEANLGDGFAAIASMWLDGAHVCLGSDSNVRIDMIEEMRWLEYVQRLQHQGRGVCIDAVGSVASGLWQSATLQGARSLGINAGMIKSGALADLVTVDLNHPILQGWTPETLLASTIFGADARIIKRVCVGGRWLL